MYPQSVKIKTFWVWKVCPEECPQTICKLAVTVLYFIAYYRNAVLCYITISTETQCEWIGDFSPPSYPLQLYLPVSLFTSK